MTKRKQVQLTIQKALPYILIVGAVVGFLASFILTMEHINLYKDPSHQLNCDLNPILSCGPIMNSKEAVIFGFPNPLMGLAMFAAQGLLGVVMLAGAKMKKWFWQLYLAGILGGIAFTLWLMYSSIFNIKALCIYCVTAWIVMFVSAWYVFQYMLAEKIITFKNAKITTLLRKHHGDILVGWFLAVIGLILYEFWYFFGKYFGF